MAASRRTTRSSAMNRPDPLDFRVQFMCPQKPCLSRPKGRFCLIRATSALGQKRTCAEPQACPLYAQKRTFVGVPKLAKQPKLPCKTISSAGANVLFLVIGVALLVFFTAILARYSTIFSRVADYDRTGAYIFFIVVGLPVMIAGVALIADFIVAP